jgi:hypothetical protein
MTVLAMTSSNLTDRQKSATCSHELFVTTYPADNDMSREEEECTILRSAT